MNNLFKTFNQTKYQLVNHGPRNVSVLKQALEVIDGQQASDLYGKGKIIENFQEKMAKFLGKETAVFFPSGTMAQQIALRIWCDEKQLKTVAYHPLSHLEIHEEDGIKELHQIKTILLADKNRVIELDDVVTMNEDIACLLLELPQREIGGQLPEYQTLEAISRYCRDKGIKLHLDGARLFEVLPYYQKSATEVCELFDSVYVSFYKGIGGLAGAILAGDQAFTEKSKVWKKRHGGDLISLYPYIISADHYFDLRKGKMDQYYYDAKELARLFNQCSGLSTIPQEPVSNMFHVHFDFPKEKVISILISIHQETGIGITSNLRDTSSESCYSEISVGDQYHQIPNDELEIMFQLLKERLSGLSFIN
ncbi:low specificity L-threonine aldolase [Aquibacillus halophilus]|uniref:Low specificity L-threonine aldolase n=1 Tax=Aquibacillus halophilus TaxID=930132 RepID=A0A6A8DH71_9BACI|nr:beta-eliminating lyase-related protein [Aquibacillus halophilus]MRH45024.1 low specificity L-threonine aldolase [Aquibacillus halophilus]